MKFFIVLALVIAAAMIEAAPIDDSQTQILRLEQDDIRPDGYKFAFETSDGVKREEEAVLKNIGSENESLAVKGSFSFVGDDGQTYTVDFIADENGYQPSGAHLPSV